MAARRQLALVLAVGALAVTGCGGEESDATADGTTTAKTTTASSGKTHKGDGFSFTYPESWREYEEDVKASAGNELSSILLSPPETDELSFINLTTYDVGIEVTEKNIDDLEGELTDSVNEIFKGGTISEGPTRTSLAGLPGYEYELTAELEGTPVSIKLLEVFDKKIQYYLYCQWVEADAPQINEGCTQMRASFELG